MPRFRVSLFVLSTIVVAGTLFIVGQSTASAGVICDTTFTGAVSSSWYVPGNWDNGVPTATSVACLGGHDVIIDRQSGQPDVTVEAVEDGSLSVFNGTTTITGANHPSDLNGGTLYIGRYDGNAPRFDFEGTGSNGLTVGNYTEVAGVNTSTGTITVTGNFDWEANVGSVYSYIESSSPGAEIQQTDPNGTATISGAQQQILYSTNLDLAAPVQIDNQAADGFSMGYGAVLTGENGITLHNSVVNQANGCGSPQPQIISEGTLATTGTSGARCDDVAVEQDTAFGGDVNFDELYVSSGATLTVPAGHTATIGQGTIDGTIDGAGTAVLGTTRVVNDPGPGVIEPAAVTIGNRGLIVSAGGTYAVSGTTTSSGNGELFLTDPGTTGSLEMDSGRLDGPGTLAVAGDVNWQGGLIGNGLSLTQPGGHQFTIGGNATHYLYGGTLTTGSPVTLSAPNLLTAANGSLTTASTLDVSSGVDVPVNGGDNASFSAARLIAPSAPSNPWGFGRDDLTLTGGTTTIPAGQFDVGNLTVGNGARLVVDGQVNDNGAVTLAGGTVRGTGSIATLVNTSGTVHPGDPSAAPGTLSAGRYSQGASGTLVIGIGNAANDQLDVTSGGAVSLAGTLSGREVGGFAPSSPDQVIAVAAGSATVSGTFGTVTGSPGSASWSAQYDSNDAFLTVQGGGEASPEAQNLPTVPAGPQVGVQQQADPGTWSDWDPNANPGTDTAAYQWLSCSDGQCVNATGSGAQTQTYTPDVADLGKTLEVAVTASNAAGAGSAATSGPSGPVANGPGAPTAHTGGAVAVTGSSASVLGVIDTAAGHPVTYHFEWGTTVAYGHTTPVVDAGDETENAIGADLRGLAPGTTYHYRLVVDNDQGESIGRDRTFTTLGPHPVTQPLTPEMPQGFAVEPVLVKPGDPSDGPDTVWVEWGTNPNNLSNSTTPAAFGVDSVSFGPVVPNTTYYFRTVAHDAQGTARGAVLSATASNQRTPTTIGASFESASYRVGDQGLLDVTVQANGGPEPTGIVTLSENGTQIGSGTLNGSGQTTIAVPAFASAGLHSYALNYAGDTYDAPSSGNTSYTVGPKWPTSVTASFESTGYRVGDQPVLDVTVQAGGGPTPTGAVTVLGNGSAVLDGNGKTTITLPALAGVGEHAYKVVYAGDGHDASSGTDVSLTALPIPSPTVSTVVKQWVGADAVWIAVTVQTQQAATLHFSGPAGLGLPPDAQVPAGGGTVDAVVQGLSATPTAVTMTATNAGGSTEDTESLVAGEIVVGQNAGNQAAAVGHGSCVAAAPVGGGQQPCASFVVSVPTSSSSATALQALTQSAQPRLPLSFFARDCLRAPPLPGAKGSDDCSEREYDEALTNVYVTETSTSGTFTQFRIAGSSASLTHNALAIAPLDSGSYSPATISDGTSTSASVGVGLLAVDSGVSTGTHLKSVELVTAGGAALKNHQNWTVNLADGEQLKLGSISEKSASTQTCGGHVQAGDIKDCLNVYVIRYTSRNLVATPTLPTVSGKPSFTSTHGTVSLSCAVASCPPVHVQLDNRRVQPPTLIADGGRVTVKGTNQAVTLTYTPYGQTLYSQPPKQEWLDLVFKGVFGDLFTASTPVTFP